MAASPAVIAEAKSLIGCGWTICAVRADKRPWGDDGPDVPADQRGKNWRRRFTLDEILERLGRNCVAIGFLGGTLNSGVVPLDFDTEEGEAWWREQCDAAGIDPDDFPTVITPGKVKDGKRRPGMHRYVLDQRGTLGNSEGELKGLGINVRGHGHAMLPPSPHPDGGVYAWAPGKALTDFEAIPDCPDFVYDAIAKGRGPKAPEHKPNGAARPTDEHAHRYCRAALDGERQELAGQKEGGRNNALNAAALKLGSLAHYHAFTEGEARASLQAACEINGLIHADGAHAFDATFASGWKAGLATPRTVPERAQHRRPRDHDQHHAAARPRSEPRPDPETGEIPSLIEPLRPFDPAEERPHLVAGLIASGQAITIIGEPGCGKTTIAVHLAVAIASGQAFFGRATRAGAVVYVAAEAPVATHKRFDAACSEIGVKPGVVPIGIMREPVRLLDVESVDRLLGDLERFVSGRADHVALVVLDTYSRCTVGGEENDASDTAIAVDAMDRIRRAFGCAVVVLHHPAKSDGRRSRGSSALVGAVDGEIIVERADAELPGTISAGKPNRDMEIFQPFAFNLKRVDLPVEIEGRPVTTVVAVPADEGSAAAAKRKPLTSSQHRALECLIDAVARDGEVPPASTHIPLGVKTVKLETWRQVCYARTLTVSDKPDAQRMAFKRAADSLIASGYVGIWQEQVWVIP